MIQLDEQWRCQVCTSHSIKYLINLHEASVILNVCQLRNFDRYLRLRRAWATSQKCGTNFPQNLELKSLANAGN